MPARNTTRLTAKQKSEIEFLEKLSDCQIDTSDIPEALFTDRAVVGKFYRPVDALEPGQRDPEE